MIEEKSYASYRHSLRSAFRALWNNVVDEEQFQLEMRTILNRRLNEAFDEGARKHGVRPSEYTQEEFLAIAKAIANELEFVPGLASVIVEMRDNNARISDLFNRVLPNWLNRYTDIKNRATVLVGDNPKLEWVYGDTVEHCNTCLKLHGKVKRAKYWQEHVMPQQPPNSKLDCGGWKCKCTLEKTDKPLSKGPLPLGL